MAGAVSVLRLPVLFCPDCGAQLVVALHVVVGSDVLVCVFCARGRPAGTVAPLLGRDEGWVSGAAPVVPLVAAVDVLARVGATLAGPAVS